MAEIATGNSEDWETVGKVINLAETASPLHQDGSNSVERSPSRQNPVLSSDGSRDLSLDTHANVHCQDQHDQLEHVEVSRPHDSAPDPPDDNNSVSLPSTPFLQKSSNEVTGTLQIEVKNDPCISPENPVTGPGKRRRVQHDYRRLSSSGYVDYYEGRERFSSTSESEFSTSPTPPKVKPLKLSLSKMKDLPDSGLGNADSSGDKFFSTDMTQEATEKTDGKSDHWHQHRHHHHKSSSQDKKHRRDGKKHKSHHTHSCSPKVVMLPVTSDEGIVTAAPFTKPCDIELHVSESLPGMSVSSIPSTEICTKSSCQSHCKKEDASQLIAHGGETGSQFSNEGETTMNGKCPSTPDSTMEINLREIKEKEVSTCVVGIPSKIYKAMTDESKQSEFAHLDRMLVKDIKIETHTLDFPVKESICSQPNDIKNATSILLATSDDCRVPEAPLSMKEDHAECTEVALHSAISKTVGLISLQDGRNTFENDSETVKAKSNDLPAAYECQDDCNKDSDSYAILVPANSELDGLVNSDSGMARDITMETEAPKDNVATCDRVPTGLVDDTKKVIDVVHQAADAVNNCESVIHESHSEYGTVPKKKVEADVQVTADQREIVSENIAPKEKKGKKTVDHPKRPGKSALNSTVLTESVSQSFIGSDGINTGVALAADCQGGKVVEESSVSGLSDLRKGEHSYHKDPTTQPKTHTSSKSRNHHSSHRHHDKEHLSRSSSSSSSHHHRHKHKHKHKHSDNDVPIAKVVENTDNGKTIKIKLERSMSGGSNSSHSAKSGKPELQKTSKASRLSSENTLPVSVSLSNPTGKPPSVAGQTITEVLGVNRTPTAGSFQSDRNSTSKDKPHSHSSGSKSGDSRLKSHDRKSSGNSSKSSGSHHMHQGSSKHGSSSGSSKNSSNSSGHSASKHHSSSKHSSSSSSSSKVISSATSSGHQKTYSGSKSITNSPAKSSKKTDVKSQTLVKKFENGHSSCKSSSKVSSTPKPDHRNSSTPSKLLDHTNHVNRGSITPKENKNSTDGKPASHSKSSSSAHKHPATIALDGSAKKRKLDFSAENGDYVPKSKVNKMKVTPKKKKVPTATLR